MLVQAPPPVPVELFTTDIAHEVGIEFDIFVPGTEKFIPTQQALLYIPYIEKTYFMIKFDFFISKNTNNRRIIVQASMYIQHNHI